MIAWSGWRFNLPVRRWRKDQYAINDSAYWYLKCPWSVEFIRTGWKILNSVHHFVNWVYEVRDNNGMKGKGFAGIDKWKNSGGGVYSERPTEKEGESENKEKGNSWILNKELKEWKKEWKKEERGTRRKPPFGERMKWRKKKHTQKKEKENK